MQMLNWERDLKNSGLIKTIEKRDLKVKDYLLMKCDESPEVSNHHHQSSCDFPFLDFFLVRMSLLLYLGEPIEVVWTYFCHKDLHLLIFKFMFYFLMLHNIQLERKFRAYSWPKKEFTFKEAKIFEVFTDWHFMRMPKERYLEIWGKEELWSDQMLKNCTI